MHNKFRWQTPPKLWQAVKVHIFDLEDSRKKGFCALYMGAACKLSSLEGNPRQRFRAERCDSHFTVRQEMDVAFSTVFSL